MHITFERRKKNTGFYILRQGVPERRSSEGCASFKQVKSWPWHVKVILGVSVVRLGTNQEFFQAVWGIVTLCISIPLL